MTITTTAAHETQQHSLSFNVTSSAEVKQTANPVGQVIQLPVCWEGHTGLHF